MKNQKTGRNAIYWCGSDKNKPDELIKINVIGKAALLK